MIINQNRKRILQGGRLGDCRAAVALVDLEQSRGK